MAPPAASNKLKIREEKIKTKDLKNEKGDILHASFGSNQECMYKKK